ncbi:MAG: BspA family leucine-rich repeat surface protein [Lachnospiraceae bacterium]|nr:BspA family leucine-rich repeat surface protein [Lachnospiraceae bacterium]
MEKTVSQISSVSDPTVQPELQDAQPEISQSLKQAENAENDAAGCPVIDSDWYHPESAKKAAVYDIKITKTAPDDPDDTWLAGDIYCFLKDDTAYICTGGYDHIRVPADATEMFRKFKNLETISGLKLLDFSACTCADSLFIDCGSLKSIDLGDCDMSHVESMDHAFSGCTSVTSIILPADLSAVTDIDYMCYNDSTLTDMDISMMDSGMITSAVSAFNACEHLKTINLGNFHMDEDCDAEYFLSQCDYLEEFTVGDMFTRFDIIPSPGDNVTDADGLWYSKNTGTAYAPPYEFPQQADTYTAHPIVAHILIDGMHFTPKDFERSRVKHIVFDPSYAPDTTELQSWPAGADDSTDIMAYLLSDGETMTVTFDTPVNDGTFIFNPSSAYMFSAFTNLESVSGLEYCSGGLISDASHMFHACNSLTSLDTQGLIGPGCTDISAMFFGCSVLKTLDLSGWDTGEVWTMASAFRDCHSLTSLDLSSLDLSSVEDMGFMFEGDTALTQVSFPDDPMPQLSCMPYMFKDCEMLEKADISAWTCADHYDIDVECYDDVDEYDKTCFGAYEGMFCGCLKLGEVDIGSLLTGGEEDSTADMFSGCIRLAVITIPADFAYKAQLPNPDKTYISGATGLWYAEDGTPYARENLPDIRGTYTAVGPVGATVNIRIKATEDEDGLYLPFGCEYRRYRVYPENDPDSYTDVLFCFTEAGTQEKEIEIPSDAENKYCIKLLDAAQRNGETIKFSQDTDHDVTEVTDGPRKIDRWNKAQATAYAVIER